MNNVLRWFAFDKKICTATAVAKTNKEGPTQKIKIAVSGLEILIGSSPEGELYIHLLKSWYVQIPVDNLYFWNNLIIIQ